MADGAGGLSEPVVRVRVWDPWVRLVHWSMVGLMLLSWWSVETDRMSLHIIAGLSMLALVVFRILWGLLGSDSARFARFLRPPAAAFRHLRDMFRREPDHETTHNPAGGWMVVILLALLLVQTVSGLFADDQLFAHGPLAQRVPGEVSDAASTLHAVLFNGLLAAAVLHVLAVLIYRVMKGQNLLRPMITGIKRMPVASATAAPRLAPVWLGAILMLAAIALAVGLWRLD